MPSDQGEPAPGVPAADGVAAPRAFARASCVLGLAVGVAALLGAWFPRSPEPLQSWDQATHLLLAAGYHDAWAREGFPAWHCLREVSSFYPPFYHVCVAALFTPPESLVGVQVVTVRFRDRRLRSFRLDRPAWDWEDVLLEIPPGLATGASTS